jgi:hypothetical protein
MGDFVDYFKSPQDALIHLWSLLPPHLVTMFIGKPTVMQIN